ncbi:MAG: hypothetical protein WKF94_08595 [Solirubrobacteraceae bacterium]
MRDQTSVTLNLDPAVAELLREHAQSEGVTEGAIVERAVRVLDIRAVASDIRSRSELDEDAAMALAVAEVKAVRAERDTRAA